MNDARQPSAIPTNPPEPTPTLPGLALCATVTAGAYALEQVERALLGQAWLEALVLAILSGTAVRTLWAPGARWRRGIAFGAKQLLEIAVVLLGATVNAAAVAKAGGALLLGIVGIVGLAVPLGFGIGRLLGLPSRMALLVACGNAICGNSAIAAVAPVIGADGDDVAASIAFTAVLGVAVVLGLPLIGGALGLQGSSFGALAGLTVYAVPQVIAASSPFGAAALQTGTVVKLMRVLMLGPVCIVLSLAMRRWPGLAPATAAPETAGSPRPRQSLAAMVPWFIVGFLTLAVWRSSGLMPAFLLAPISHVATLLTVVSMAALGLGVDVRSVLVAGGRVTAAVVLSLAVLGGMSLLLVRLLPLT